MGCVTLQTLCTGVVLLFAALTGEAAAVSPRFNRDIRPILSDKCFACHGPDAASREADLRFDLRESALQAIVPGDPDASALVQRVTATDPAERMPPPEHPKTVSAAEVALLRDWIAAGAEYEGHWSFEPVRATEPPRSESDWPANDIDRFVLAKLQGTGLQPNPPADRATLIRRVTLDLTGLPPAPDEVQAFVNDPASDAAALETVVDRLLASPRFGEHLAWHWLDAARYGDSDGYESDPLRNMWPWRDWVIEAFNRNLPYDQFIVQQLAGDLLPGEDLRPLIASGFNRNHRLNNEGGTLPEEWLIEYVCDRAETTATVFMGLTWGCARCHDHKFDPISQRDYYQLFAFFHNVPEIGNGFGESSAVPMRSVPSLDRLEEYVALEREYAPLRQRLDDILRSPEFGERFDSWRSELTDEQRTQLPKELREVDPATWKDAQLDAARQHFLTTVDEAGRVADAAARPLREQTDALLRTGAKIMVMGELETPRTSHILTRGQYDQPAEVVEMATPAWLPPLPDGAPHNRLGLAQWLVAPEHPLTSRVAVNRFWQLLFGAGLVRTPEDFGVQGERPTHPELLDWLAASLMNSGWDTKQLLKLIVLSRTYQQAATVTDEHLQIDPQNRLLARGARFRLPAAVIRDQALATAGLLVEHVGGPPVKPYQPDGLWQDIIKGRPVYKRDAGDSLYRRSLYSLWRRAVKPPELTLLDANERDVCTVTQRRTNTPLQALLTLNDIAFVEASRGLATRVLDLPGQSTAERLQAAAHITLARPLKPSELAILQAELDSARATFAREPAAAARLLAVGETPAPRALEPQELASWTLVCRILLNLDETLTRQ